MTSRNDFAHRPDRTLDGSGTLCTTVLLSRRSHGENSLNPI
jgi:hypothetical protein